MKITSIIPNKASLATTKLMKNITSGIDQLSAAGKVQEAETFSSFCELELTIEEAEAVLESIKEALS